MYYVKNILSVINKNIQIYNKRIDWTTGRVKFLVYFLTVASPVIGHPWDHIPWPVHGTTFKCPLLKERCPLTGGVSLREVSACERCPLT